MLTQREQQILRAIVNEYMTSAQPVGSRLLVTRYGLGVSPATIRNVMAALTQAGYLQQPHTSAGRVPTERAYRLFLENAEASAPSIGEQEKIALRIGKAGDPQGALRKLAQQLSEVSGAVGVAVTAGSSQLFGLANVFGHPEFQDPRVAAYLAELLDQSPEWVPRLSGKAGQVAVRIGAENDDFRARQVSVLATKVPLLKDSFLAVVGPTRMPYRKLSGLMEFAGKELAKTYG